MTMGAQCAEIHTDGSFLGDVGKPAPTGWAYVLRHGDQVQRHAGHCLAGNSSASELIAVIKAFEALPPHISTVRLCSDSQYVGQLKNLKDWKRHGWKKINGSGLDNKKLWIRFDDLIQGKCIEFVEIRKSKSDDIAFCHRMAREAMKKLAQQMLRKVLSRSATRAELEVLCDD